MKHLELKEQDSVPGNGNKVEIVIELIHTVSSLIPHLFFIGLFAACVLYAGIVT
jgi:hypothetical protein